LTLEQGLILGQEGIEMGGEHPVEHGGFRMPLFVYGCHTGKEISQESGRIAYWDVTGSGAKG